MTLVAFQLIRFTSLWQQALGLMFRKPASATIYLFDFKKPVTHSFHMFFVFWPIDLYLLDKQRRVVDLQRRFRPFTTFQPKKEYWFAVETATGLLKVKVGERLTW